MKKRKMPAHIVLPNGMWRFVKSGTKKAISKVKTKVKRKKSRSGFMARRRKFRTSHRSGNKLMKGLIPTGGIIGAVLLGAGAATLQEKLVPQVMPYQSEIAGFAVGGLGGAAGAFARNLISGRTGVSNNAVTGY